MANREVDVSDSFVEEQEEPEEAVEASKEEEEEEDEDYQDDDYEEDNYEDDEGFDSHSTPVEEEEEKPKVLARETSQQATHKALAINGKLTQEDY